ncbi:MAG: 3-phosphoshikimate 1-carboxyvinyltransferase [Atopobiaceae bacterium]
MDAIVTQSQLSGVIPAIPSKSMAHRLMILAALCPSTTDIHCGSTSMDMEATASCLRSLGARVTRTQLGYRIVPLRGRADSDNHPDRPDFPTLDCGESGSTLRFLLPVAAALGGGASFVGHGRLAQRPLSPLYEQLQEHGVTLSAQGQFPLVVQGKLRPGRFVLPGDVSSQFVSGLLMAAPLLDSPSEVWVSEPIQSRPYITLTMNALEKYGIHVAHAPEVVDSKPYTSYLVAPATLVSPGVVDVEGDWSNAAFWLAAGAQDPEGVTVTGLDLASAQGDRVIMAALSSLGVRIARKGSSVRATRDAPHAAAMDVSDFPDLVPPLAAVAAVTPGTTALRNAGRLRLKESDRLESVSQVLGAMGIRVQVDGDDLLIDGGHAHSAEVDAHNDHRIAMMAAILAAGADGPVTIHGAECVRKSYPAFWDDFARLGGHVQLTKE